MDISHDDKLMVYNQNRSISIFKGGKQEGKELHVGMAASMARFIPKSQNLALMVGQNGIVESWDISNRKKLMSTCVSGGAQVTDLSF